MKKQDCPRPECPNTPPRLRLLNTQTGEIAKLSCKAYACPVCGIRKKMQLQNALERVLSSWESVRMWTFTASSNNLTPVQHAELMRLSWRKFTKYLRTSPIVPKAIKTIQYIKFVELHKSGHIHFHVLVDKYVHWDFFQVLWVHICKQVFKSEEKISHVNVVGSRDAKAAAKYVSKYVSKAACEKSGQHETINSENNLVEKLVFRLYSKSQKIILFPKNIIAEGKSFWRVVLAGSMVFLNSSSMAQVSVEAVEIEVELLELIIFEPPEPSKAAILAQFLE